MIEARSGAHALGLLEQAHEPIDLLLTDIVMPGVDGRTLANVPSAQELRWSDQVSFVEQVLRALTLPEDAARMFDAVSVHRSHPDQRKGPTAMRCANREANALICDARHVPRSAGIELVSLLVADYDPAIAFFVDVLGFELLEDSAAVSTRTGQAKRWVVVRPRHAHTGILLARADNDAERAAIGNQHGGRVGFFLRVDDFDIQLARMRAANVQLVGEPRQEPYGRVLVFIDLLGNRWDLLG
ncbi:hypothetical protein BH11MYX1_BH11MYX1_51530 [soil metagenome]